MEFLSSFAIYPQKSLIVLLLSISPIPREVQEEGIQPLPLHGGVAKFWKSMWQWKYCWNLYQSQFSRTGPVGQIHVKRFILRNWLTQLGRLTSPKLWWASQTPKRVDGIVLVQMPADLGPRESPCFSSSTEGMEKTSILAHSTQAKGVLSYSVFFVLFRCSFDCMRPTHTRK